MCVRLRVLLAAPRHFLSPFAKMTRDPCLERHPKHEISRYEHVCEQVSKQVHLDRCAIVQLSQPCAPSAWPCHVVRLRGETRQVCVHVLE